MRLFSGRPDPTWSVTEAVATKLEAAIKVLVRTSAMRAAPPPLGYRGCFVVTGDGEMLVAYRGWVAGQAGNSDLTYLDPGRAFERLLLATAPTGSWNTTIRSLLSAEGL